MFPSSIDSFQGFVGSETLQTANHAAQHDQEQAAIVAIENKVGTGASTPTSGTVLAGSGTGTSAWRALTGADVGFNQTTVLQAVYPIGAIYTETTGVNPSTIFGFGTWVATGKGQVLIGAGTSDQTFTAGATGGESNHTLTSNEMPSHTHTVNDPGHNHTYNFNNTIGNIAAGGGIGANTPALNTSTSTTGITNNNTGGGTAHNNLPSYLVIYYWQRIA